MKFINFYFYFFIINIPIKSGCNYKWKCRKTNIVKTYIKRFKTSLSTKSINKTIEKLRNCKKHIFVKKI